jgi:hypothetical protein
MANFVRGIDKVSSLSEESVNTSGNHNSFDLTLLDRRTRVDTITRTFGDWQRFSSQGRLQDKTNNWQKPLWIIKG